MTVAERRRREREARREEILEAAERVFWEQGFEAAKMGDIARAAQLGKGTLYLYFRTKEDLALGLATRHQRAMLAHFAASEAEAASGIEVLRSNLCFYVDRMSTPREHLQMVVGRWASGVRFAPDSAEGAEAEANIAQIFVHVLRAIRRAQDEGDLRPDLTPNHLAHLMWTSVNGFLLVELKMCSFEAMKVPTLAMRPPAGEHIDLLLDTLRPPVARRSGLELKRRERNET